MDDQNQQQNQPNIEDIKAQVRREILNLADRLDNPRLKFQAYMDSLEDEAWDNQLGAKALEQAKRIEDPEEKLRALQEISRKIYYHQNPINK